MKRVMMVVLVGLFAFLSLGSCCEDKCDPCEAAPKQECSKCK